MFHQFTIEKLSAYWSDFCDLGTKSQLIVDELCYREILGRPIFLSELLLKKNNVQIFTGQRLCFWKFSLQCTRKSYCICSNRCKTIQLSDVLQCKNFCKIFFGHILLKRVKNHQCFENSAVSRNFNQKFDFLLTASAVYFAHKCYKGFFTSTTLLWVSKFEVFSGKNPFFQFSAENENFVSSYASRGYHWRQSTWNDKLHLKCKDLYSPMQGTSPFLDCATKLSHR